jgi:hypothetical protein
MHAVYLAALKFQMISPWSARYRKRSILKNQIFMFKGIKESNTGGNF